MPAYSGPLLVENNFYFLVYEKDIASFFVIDHRLRYVSTANDEKKNAGLSVLLQMLPHHEVRTCISSLISVGENSTTLMALALFLRNGGTANNAC